ncbi:MAG: DUF308 domain-containing protein [Erysipelotrichaceae bacterium]|nr:DUF308 domain-containing protein [Erysipelotrichaceae bacterium]
MKKFLNVMVGSFFVGFGLFLWLNPVTTLVTYSFYLGMLHLLGTIGTLIFYVQHKIQPIPYGAIMLSFLIGMIILFIPKISLTVLLWVLVGSMIALSGYWLFHILTTKEKHWTAMLQLLLACAGVVYALVLLFYPDTGFKTLAKVIAGVVILNGLSYFIAIKKNKS